MLLEPGQEDTAQFLAEHQVHVVASMPCYSEKNVDSQRGSGVFDRSIEVRAAWECARLCRASKGCFWFQ